MSPPPGRSLPALRATHLGETLAYYALLPLVWARQFIHNSHGILRVLDITRFRPLPAGLIDAQHPWVTGLNPDTGRPIWHANVLYCSPRPAEPSADLPPDEAVITGVGRFLAGQVARSAVVPEIPWGPRRRMPHGINYIHGAVHYNSGILLFTDFADALYHFTDRRFVAEVCRFARTERREVLLMFRRRRYTAREFAYLVGFLRTLMPWFCNSNGPQKRVLWGNHSPFPVVNIIAGNWIRDVYRLREPGGLKTVVRPPIPASKYLVNGPYQGCRRESPWPGKLLAHWTYQRIRWRGARGGLFFVDRRRLLTRRLERLRQQGMADEPIAAL